MNRIEGNRGKGKRGEAYFPGSLLDQPLGSDVRIACHEGCLPRSYLPRYVDDVSKGMAKKPFGLLGRRTEREDVEDFRYPGQDKDCSENRQKDNGQGAHIA